VLCGNDQCVRESYECGTRSACSVSVLDFHPGVFDCIVTGGLVCVLQSGTSRNQKTSSSICSSGLMFVQTLVRMFTTATTT